MRSRSSTTRPRRSRRATKAPTRHPLGREDWIVAARTELIAGGVSAVKIGRLAKRLRVTRGGFYWHFTSRADLLSELIESWEVTNTAPFERLVANGNAHDGVYELLSIANLWLDEKEYSPAFDTAVRDWARTSKAVAAVVQRVDQHRIAILQRIFLDLGFADLEADVRARVAYFHQVGYYTLHVHDDRRRRRERAPMYLHVLSGLPLDLIHRKLASLSQAPVIRQESKYPAGQPLRK